MIHIIGGESKGRKIKVKRNLLKRGQKALRPTSAKVRKALFDIIKDRISVCSFLDLYAGTGAVGFEALSRGASKVVFVDNNASRITEIKKMIQALGVEHKAQAYKETAVMYIERLKGDDNVLFDIIFADPPYDSQEVDKIMPLIVKKDILRKDGLFIIEHPSRRSEMLIESGNLRLLKQYRYGDTTLSLYAQI